MLQDMIHPPEQLSIDDVSSPISSQILEFCDPDFLQETLQNSEVTSSLNCCCEDNCCYTDNHSVPPDIVNFSHCQDNDCNTKTATSTTTATTASTTTATSNTTITTANTNHNSSSSNNNNNGSNLSVIFDPQDDFDNEISASIDFSSSPTFPVPQYVTTQQGQFEFYSVQPPLALTDVMSADGLPQYPADPVAPVMSHTLPPVFEEDCLSSVPSYLPLNPSSPSCTFLVPPMSAYMPPGPVTAALSAGSTGIFAGSIPMGPELQPQDLEYQGDNGGIYCTDSIQHVFNPGDLQALSSETQQLVSGAGSSTPLASDIPSLEDSNFKVGKLSVEQRKEKIHRYMKKRNERNFSKKIKYACRKTLADSRPRVRGRFAKNDDFGETPRAACSHHEEDEDDEAPVKEEDDMVDSADIFAHISGVNSFKCNYSIQSWI